MVLQENLYKNMSAKTDSNVYHKMITLGQGKIIQIYMG